MTRLRRPGRSETVDADRLSAVNDHVSCNLESGSLRRTQASGEGTGWAVWARSRQARIFTSRVHWRTRTVLCSFGIGGSLFAP